MFPRSPFRSIMSTGAREAGAGCVKRGIGTYFCYKVTFFYQESNNVSYQF
jgi:hypothetical protein